MKLIDTNCNFGRWPWTQAGSENAEELKGLLNRENISEAWVSSIPSLLADDLEACEENMREKLAGEENLGLVRTLNPLLGGMEKQFQRAREIQQYVAVRLAPTLHHYRLFESEAIRLCHVMESAGPPYLPVLVLLRFDDIRQRRPGLVTLEAQPLDLVNLAQRFPKLSFVAQGATVGETNLLAGRRFIRRDAGNIWMDTSFLDFMDTLCYTASNIAVNRLLFGTAEPFLYARSNILHFTSTSLSLSDREAIAWGNAQSLLAK